MCDNAGKRVLECGRSLNTDSSFLQKLPPELYRSSLCAKEESICSKSEGLAKSQRASSSIILTSKIQETGVIKSPVNITAR